MLLEKQLTSSLCSVVINNNEVLFFPGKHKDSRLYFRDECRSIQKAVQNFVSLNVPVPMCMNVRTLKRFADWGYLLLNRS